MKSIHRKHFRKITAISSKNVFVEFQFNENTNKGHFNLFLVSIFTDSKECYICR